MRVINHSWSATKQRLHPHRVADRDKPPFSFVRGQDSTTWDIVWVSPQRHRSVSVFRHFLLQHRSVPVPCENGSAEITVAEGGRNPVAVLWGHTLGNNWDMEIYRFSKWRPSAILELFYHHTRTPAKSLLLPAAACQISSQSDTEIWRYSYLNFLHIWLEMPIQATLDP